MRKITEQITRAFMEGRRLEISNSKTDGHGLWLFNNKIAEITHNGVLMISDGGYGVSATTKERLNGLSGVNLRIKKGEWLLNEEPWDGSWIKIQKVR